VQQILDQFSRRPQLTNAQRDTLTHIRSFMEASLEAENKGDVRQADALAERAQILARDLINAK
jgi:DNA-directed RNA polymerase subunit F